MDEGIHQRIDDYLNDSLPPDELAAFEKELAASPELANQVREQKEVLQALENFHIRKNVRNTVSQVHNEMTRVDRKMRSKVLISKRRRFFSTLAIAASVSVITFISTMYIIKRKEYLANAQENTAIQELSDVVYSMSDEQQSIIDKINFLEERHEEPESMGIGSCILINETGYFLTSHHLVKNARFIRLSRQSDSLVSFNAKVVFRDNQFDLALLKAEDSLKFEAPRFVLSQKAPRLGDYLFTLGYPKNDVVFGEGSLSSKTGHKGDTTSYQISIPANPGNSGGPVINESGELSGMISGRHRQNEAATYAITSETIEHFFEDYHAQLDSTEVPLEFNTTNSLRRMQRADKIESIERFVFKVEASIPRHP